MVDGGDQVLLHGSGLDGVGFAPGEHVEVVGRVREVVARFHRLQPLSQPVQGSEQGGHRGAGGEGVGGPAGGVEIVDRAEAGGGAQQGEGGAESGERPGQGGGAGECGQGASHLVGESAQGSDLGGEGVPLGKAGGSAPRNIRCHTSSKVRLSASSTAEYWR